MAYTNLTRRQMHDPRAVADRLAAHDTDIDDLKVTGEGLVEDGSITTAKLDDDAVTTDKLDDEAVTGVKLDSSAIKSYVVAAGNGAAARTMTGANVGDEVIACVNLSDLTNDLAAGDVEDTVSVEDQLQQLQANHTGDKWLVLVVAKS